MQGTGCRVKGAGCRVQGAGCRVQGEGRLHWRGGALRAEIKCSERFIPPKRSERFGQIDALKRPGFALLWPELSAST